MNFLERLKDDLDMMSESNIMITVKRKDLETIINEYEKLLKEKEGRKNE
ncbi:MAG TPA: hypothetical protein H9667_10330 [Firmicutes bacterium]|nr:hypothetical protein [Bacillota bacterium]